MNKAVHPERLSFGIHWQHDGHEFFEEIMDPRLKVIETNYRQSRGTCWARHEAQKLYNGEDFVLQLDSHMRFVHGWDLICIDGIRHLQQRGNKKVVISNVMPAYDPENDRILPQVYLTYRLGQFHDDGIICQSASSFTEPPRERFSPGFTLSAAFIFSIGDLYRDVIIDPDLYFNGQEISYAVQAYTHGYDIYHCHHPIVYHHYNRSKAARHWIDHDGWWKSSDHAKARVRSLIARTNEVPDLGLYGLGTERSIEDYEYNSGIDFKARAVVRFEGDGYFGPRAIREKLKTTKIAIAQIDPFSYCNARCWYCPVRYEPQPARVRKHMPVALFENIIREIIQNKGNNGIVAPAFRFVYTAHYNEILLYKHLAEMVEILRKHKLGTLILTNGIPLSPEKTDLIKKYDDVIGGNVCINISRFEKGKWIDNTLAGNGRSAVSMERAFERTMENIAYASGRLSRVSIQINDPDPEEAKRQAAMAQNLFPAVNIYTSTRLSDRAGILSDKGVLSNQNEIASAGEGKSGIIGCRNTVSGIDGRHFGWIHVNSLGEAILCCNDYRFDYTFGNFREEKLKDMWLSNRHIEVIARSFREICTKCNQAIWK